MKFQKPKKSRPAKAGTPAPAPRPAPPKPKHRPKKRLGQNFLRDASVIAKIIEAAELSPDDQVLEIGPGRGVLTSELAPRAGKVVAVELDRHLKEDFLDPLEQAHESLAVIYQDFLKTPWEELPFEAGKPVKVVANIPYYITTPILMKLLQAPRVEKEPLSDVTPRAERILLMVQWEVAKRLTAPPGNKDFGSLSLFAQYAAEVSVVTKVPAGAFRPVPEVDSAVVKLVPRRTPPVEVKTPAVLFRIIRGAFQQRRKTLQNGLMGAGFLREDLATAAQATGIDLGRRAESLSLAEFAALANALTP